MLLARSALTAAAICLAATPSMAQAPDIASLYHPPTATVTGSEEASATAVSFIAALFARDCGFVARRVDWPADLDGIMVQVRGDIIPDVTCSVDAAWASPLSVLATNGLQPVNVETEIASDWLSAPARDAAAPFSVDVRRYGGIVVTVTFGDGPDRVHRHPARVLISGARGAMKVKAYRE